LGELRRVCLRGDAAGLVDVALSGVVGWVAESGLDLAEEAARGADVVCELPAGELGTCLSGSAGAVVEEVVGAQCVEELKERVLGELASGERSSSKSDMDQLLAYVLGGFFAAPAQRL
jgi:hypothetical protein